MTLYNATMKLANHIGFKVRDTDDFVEIVKNVFLVKPLENSVGSTLQVYGVKTIYNGVKTFTFYCADYGCDRFKSVITCENPSKVRQCGDATLVGSKVIGW